MKRLLSLLILALLPFMASAYDVLIDGIYYNLDLSEKTASVTCLAKYSYGNENAYSGTVEIPNEVTYNEVTYKVTDIGESAFYRCTGLNTVIIPNSVTTIGQSAFESCYNLNSINIPNGVKTIGEGAFEYCSSLESIEIPNSVTNIGYMAFRGTSWYNNQPDGMIYAGLIAYSYKGTMPEQTEIIIKDGTIGISKNAFQYCENLTSVIIPMSISTIDERVFYGCSDLKTVTLPCSVMSIGNSAFAWCTSLTSIDIPNSVTTIDNMAFNGCSSLTSIVIPNSVENIGAQVFEDCKSITDITIGRGTKNIGNYTFRNCIGLTTLTFQTVPLYGYKIFNGCDNIKKVIFEEGEINDIMSDIVSLEEVIIKDDVTSIGESAFKGCTSLTTVLMGSGVFSIGNYAFSGCNSLTSVSLGESVVSIGNEAFTGCGKITSFIIPNNVKEIGEGAFSYCQSLTSLVIENGTDTLIYDGNDGTASPLKTLHLGRNIRRKIDNSYNYIPFRDTNTLNKITIGNTVTYFNPLYFAGCANLEEIILEDGFDDLNIGDYNFSTCPIQFVYLGRNIKATWAPFEISCPFTLKIGKIVTSLFGLANCTGLSTVEIPENVKKIESNTFAGCSNLTEIKIPNSVKEIGSGVFRDCSSLSSISLPDNLTTISWSIFDGCSNLIAIDIPEGVTDIGGWAFNNCSKLKNVSIPPAVKAIGIRAFYGCSNLSSVIIPNSVTDIYNWAFYGCKKLTDIIFENGTDSLEFWGEDSNNEAFKESGLSRVFLGRSIGYTKSHPLRKSPLANLESLKEITIDINISNGSAFKGGNIESVTITNNVTKISTSALQDFTGLKSVTIEDSEKILDCDEGGNFYHCPLESVYLGRNISYINESPFRYNREGLKTLIIGDDVTELGEGVFSGHSGMTSLTLSKKLKTIGKQAFYGCEGLTSVFIPNSVMEIGDDAFDLTRGLTSFTIEDGTEELSINNNFLNSPLGEVYLGRNIDYPEGKSPFSMLEPLKQLKIGKDVSSINEGAFAGCQNLKDVVSYAVNVPTTGQNVFTESYLSDATLHVLDQAYKDYSKTFPWYLFKNFMLIDADGNETPLPSSEGDASDNGMVNAEDIVEVVSYMMGYPSEGFSNKYADVNCDGIINIADIVSIVNIIMGQ